MRIEVVLSPTLYEGRNIKVNHYAVAVDVLRATSAVCAAFVAGAEEIVPLDSLEQLPLYRRMGYTLAAERNGEKLHGATCGNSPTEYMTMDLSGQKLAYSTTNGTVSILRAADSDRLFVGSFPNIDALASQLVAGGERDIVVLCSGWKGDPSLEDTVFAGALIDRIGRKGVELQLVNDAAMMALALWNDAKSDLYSYCLKATHVQRLLRLGCEDDIRWSLTSGLCRLVPEYVNGKLIAKP